MRSSSRNLCSAEIEARHIRCLRVVCIAQLVLLAPAVRAEGNPPWIADGGAGMVASDSAEASAAGLEILRAGGNAVDAATAVSFALAVTRPYSTGVGGGGFTIIRQADGQVIALDYRETAPAAATREMYHASGKQSDGRVVSSVDGHLAAGVPGMIAGRHYALQRCGTMTWRRTLAPAIKLAREGFAVDEHYVASSRDALVRYEREPALKRTCSYVFRVHLNNGKLLAAGDWLKQPALSRFLEGIALEGPDLFYKRRVAQAIEREMARHGGLIRASDLGAYEAKPRAPITGAYRGYSIIAMPPPSSGGATLVQILNTLEPIEMRTLFKDDPLLASHYRVEAMKHAFADRARWFGDSDFARVPVGHLTSKQYGKQISVKIRADKPMPLEQYGMRQLPEDSGTSHFCVADRMGNVVVSSETINTVFGSLAAVAEWGIIFNNQMDDFTTQPGKANEYALIQSEKNAVAPGKRPLSSMCPTIVLKDDQPYLLIGASGGPRIISSVLNVLTDLIDRGMTLEAALQAPRPHHQWQPDEIFFNRSPPAALAVGLQAKGHRISDRRRTSVVQAILRTADGWQGASDPHKGGRPAGY